MAYNILIVDDSFPMRAVIKKIIRASGFRLGQVHEAGNGREALTVLNDQWLDLVLTDYNMPDMNGLELIRQMKQNETTKDIPVVVITTEGSDRRVAAFMKEGATAYVKKPFTAEQIKYQLNQLLGEPDDGRDGHDDCNESFDF